MSAVREIETDAPPARPAPDEIDEQLHPSLTPFLVGHEDAEATLASGITENALHHAWLLAGPQGIGKATLAYRLARRLLSDEAGGGLFGEPEASLHVDPDDPVVAQVASGGHPNLLRLTRQWDFKRQVYYTEVRAPDVRQLNTFFGQSVGGEARRVVIVDAAEDMNNTAANALLKPLEEPPANATFILVSHRPDRLLPTIHSRCRRLTLRAPDLAQSLDVLNRLSPDIGADDAALLLALSSNAPGEAVRLARQDGLDAYRQVLALFRALPDTGKAVQALAKGIEGNRDTSERRFFLVTGLIEGVAERMIRHALPGTPPPAAALAEEQELSAHLVRGGLEQWFDLCDNLRRLRERTAAVNLNRKAVFLTLIGALQAASR